MGRVLALLMMVALMGCSQAPGGAATGSATPASAPGSSGVPTAEAPSSAASAPASASTTVVLPANCAAGLAAYLVAIEPLVKSFDPAKATLGDLSSTDEATSEKAFELLDANGGRAPYSCSEVGLEWAYFDSNTPWDAVLAVAADAAPGTVPYLTGLRATTALDEAELSDYQIAGCDEAVAAIKKRVADESPPAPTTSNRCRSTTAWSSWASTRPTSGRSSSRRAREMSWATTSSGSSAPRAKAAGRLAVESIDHGGPRMYADPTHDPRIRQ